MQSRSRKVLQTFWNCLTVLHYCFIWRPFSSPEGRYSLEKYTHILRTREVSQNEGSMWKERAGLWKGRWCGYTPAGACNVLSPDEPGVNAQQLDPASQAADRHPIHCTPGWLCPAFAVWPLFVILKISISTFGQQILRLQLFSAEDGDKEEEYLPDLCKCFQQTDTHTQGTYSLGRTAKPSSTWGFLPTVHGLAPGQDGFILLEISKAHRVKTWTFTVYINRMFSTDS